MSGRGARRKLTRRRLISAAALTAGGVGLSVFAVSCGSSGGGSGSDTRPSETSEDGAPRSSATLRVALTGNPPNLDIHQTTDSIVLLICSHMYETLFTWNAEYLPVPLLASSHETFEGGLRNRIVLRDDVKFHNGESLRAADVVASIERWSSISGLGEGLMAAVDSIELIDDLTIDFHMAEPYGAFRTALSRQLQGCAIYPESVLLQSTRTNLAEYVGTGPYRFVEWLPDRHVRAVRFDEYRENSDEPDGYSGLKAAHFDTIDFMPVRNEASRIAGMQAQDYHFVETVSSDQAPVLEAAATLSVDVLPADSWLNIVFNLRSPTLEDLRVRRAIQLALDHESIMLAAVGEGFFELSPELAPGAPAWHTEAGIEFFNRNDPAESRRLLEEAEYDGTPLRFMVTQEIQQEYNAALTMKQELEDVGFTVDLLVYDGATLSDRRNDESAWEMYAATASFRPDPVMRNLTSTATGWWGNPEKDDLFTTMQLEADHNRRFEAWERLQFLFYEDVPRLKIGNIRRLLARSASLQGIGPTEMQPEFSNAWLEE